MRKLSVIKDLKANAMLFINDLDKYIKEQEKNEDDYLRWIDKKDFSIDFNIGPYRVFVETDVYPYQVKKAVFKVSFIDIFSGEKGEPIRELYSSCGTEGKIIFASRKTKNKTDDFPHATPEEIDVTQLGYVDSTKGLAEEYIFQIEKYISNRYSEDQFK
ncbi:hypothetical protein CCY01nite_17730 [Chitinophaga cymbidii]|uniref:Uncharacterized protein n=2 Tax=Chitinophaga cymbidii TaxID=1096750 RepID=A0A512RII5_9BACT|nr:hypothetical protein CCY01nite_17730 [Chitinophaga cymbidii]